MLHPAAAADDDDEDDDDVAICAQRLLHLASNDANYCRRTTVNRQKLKKNTYTRC